MHVFYTRYAGRVKAGTPFRHAARPVLFYALLVCLVLAGCDAPSGGAPSNAPSNAQVNAAPPVAPNTKAGDVAGDRMMSGRAANPLFNPSLEQVDKAFSQGESLAKNSGKKPLGESKVLEVHVQGHKPLKLSIFFMSPLAEARNKGYDFGKRPGGTVADRAEVINLITKKLNRDVTFFTDLPISNEVSNDDNASLPSISFELLDGAGGRVRPREQPGFQIPPQHDLLASNEFWVSFPLQGSAGPHITDKMDSLTLVVRIGDDEQELVFNLK